MKLTPSPQFSSVQEQENEFLKLWTHRFDYLWAKHPHPNERPDWKTESRHPLSDRLIQQGAHLYGVRFASSTHYFLLDIDRSSVYHPIRDAFAWRRMVAALESLGLVQPVICTSSYSGGLHLYFPFDTAQQTWAIALAVSTLLERAGFRLAPGQLEVFPNCKAYSNSGEHSLYNGHRLPMGAGSYLLNQDLQLIWSNQDTFVQHWQFAQHRNSLDMKALNRILKSARRRNFRISHKADKFLNDLNTEIEQGWTGSGQTNRLLGRIAMRSYIFAHVVYANAPLEGHNLVNDIVNIARSLPGYEEWCQHQHEIEQRAIDWAQSVESSRYFHYGSKKPPSERNARKNEASELSRNQQTQREARERIRQAVAELSERATLPMAATARFKALVRYKISGQTLYRHQDLWHPKYLQPVTKSELQSEEGQDRPEEAPCLSNRPSLLGGIGCNSLPDVALSPLQKLERLEMGCNSLSDESLEDLKPKERTPEEGLAHLKQILKQVEVRRQMEKTQVRANNAKKSVIKFN